MGAKGQKGVKVTLRDVHGAIIRDKVRLTFANQRVRSLNRRYEVAFQGRPATIDKDLPAGPNGIYQIFITPETYREKSVFLMLPLGRTAEISETLFVDPDRAKPKFPSYSELKREKGWGKLVKVLAESGFGVSNYNTLDARTKAGIFNLYAKMEATGLPDGTSVFDHVSQISDPKPARFYSQVSPDLRQLVIDAREAFHAVPGALHPFPSGWERIETLGSFKTLDRAGNLQLTFATNKNGKFLVDADIDDHQGLEHAFDVVKHKLTGKDTHPYDIHQVLVFVQGIDPGYRLV